MYQQALVSFPYHDRPHQRALVRRPRATRPVASKNTAFILLLDQSPIPALFGFR